jgi:hypothetical protein
MYDARVRTTVDFPPALDMRARELAKSRAVSLSSVYVDLATRGLAQLGEQPLITVDAETGFPMISIGRRITNEYVAEMIEE